MAKAPAFQFYARDWLSSSRVMLMTPEQEGAYLRLLCYCWDSGDCSLADDDAALARLSRLGPRWLRFGKPIRDCFDPHPDKPGFITNERLWSEHLKQREWREKCARGGKGSSRVVEVPLGENSGKKQDSPPRVDEVNGNTASSSSSSSSSAKKRKTKDTPSESADAAALVPRSQPTGPHHEAISAFTTRWQAKYGDKYPFAAAKDAAAVKAMLERCGGDVEKFTRAAERYLADADPFYAGHGLAMMQTRLERWLVPAAKVAPRGKIESIVDYNAQQMLDAYGGST